MRQNRSQNTSNQVPTATCFGSNLPSLGSSTTNVCRSSKCSRYCSPLMMALGVSSTSNTSRTYKYWLLINSLTMTPRCRNMQKLAPDMKCFCDPFYCILICAFCCFFNMGLSVSVIQTTQLMLYREIIAVCSQIHTKHINTLCGQNVELYIKTQSVPRSKHSPSQLYKPVS